MKNEPLFDHGASLECILYPVPPWGEEISSSTLSKIKNSISGPKYARYP